MKTKISLLLILGALSLNSILCAAQGRDIRVSLGLGGGLSQNMNFSGDLFFGLVFPINNYKAEVNFGYSYFNNTTHFVDFNDLLFNSHGTYAEGNFFFTPNLFAGLRLATNFNWVSKASRAKFEEESVFDSPTFFTGTAGYAQLGYYYPFSDKIGLRLQGQIGLHHYSINEGWIIIDDGNGNIDHPTEKHNELLYNFNIGLTYFLK